MRYIVCMALALAAQLLGAGLSPAQRILEENPYYLRADKRLQVSLPVEADHPKIAQIVTQLCEATHLDIAVDAGLQDHAPELGYIQPSQHGYHAWQIMEMIAKKDLQRGYWEKTEGGYRLVGTSLATAPQTSSEDGGGRLLAWMTALAISLLGVLLLVLILRKRSLRTGKHIAAKER